MNTNKYSMNTNKLVFQIVSDIHIEKYPLRDVQKSKKEEDVGNNSPVEDEEKAHYQLCHRLCQR